MASAAHQAARKHQASAAKKIKWRRDGRGINIGIIVGVVTAAKRKRNHGVNQSISEKAAART